MSLPVVAALLAALTALAGCHPAAGDGETAMMEQVRRELKAEPPGTDAAVILAQALRDAEAATPAKREGILRDALKQAEKARRFTSAKEFPMPKDNPKPSMPPLSDEEKRVILQKGTERPFSGKYWNQFEPGVYVCRQCGAELYASTSKFRSECGWPSFDDEIPGAVSRRPDPDGHRTEIICAACGGHLGHVFEGEGLTAKNTRHCVNSASLVFRPQGKQDKDSKSGSRHASADGSMAPDKAAAPATAAAQEATFAGGCFWGVEHLFERVEGVLDATSGYTGGGVPSPTYEQVCTGRTGHAEAVRVRFDPSKVAYEKLARLFFEIHDPTQKDRQGPDVGSQYRSVVFYRDAKQKETAEKLIKELRALGYPVVTEVAAAGEFYPAEQYHQDYLVNHPGRPVCHSRVPRFDTPAKP